MSAKNTEKRFPSSTGVIEQILKDFRLKPAQITPLGLPWYNKFIFRVDLTAVAVPGSFPQQPATIQPPLSGVSSLIIHFADPEAYGFNNANRIENTVAAQQLVRRALLTFGLPDLIPATYAWAPYRPEFGGGKGPGWYMQEFRPGEELIKVFPTMTLGEKKDIALQIATVFACMQEMKLPAGVTKFGGLMFDEDGNVVDGQSPVVNGGPWDTDRIDRFVADGGVRKLLENVDVSKRVLVQGDFTTWNMLYDVNSRRITRFLGFDCASVTHPCHEYFSGFDDFGSGVRLGKKEDQFLLTSVLSGNFDQVPPSLSNEQTDKWDVAKEWDTALAGSGMICLSSIAGIRELLDLRVLISLICPTELRNKFLLKVVSKEAQERMRAEVQVKLLTLLEQYTY
ncbi:hypothetical protein GQ53DRAFT_821481 [Thozetella sp. PMI_491]|nr:hypothetical protein GQ53DRAFT_821481 [Thozetella sp. PMI_491]